MTKEQTIYLVYRMAHRGHWIVRICARREDAEAFVANDPENLYIQPWDMVLDDGN